MRKSVYCSARSTKSRTCRGTPCAPSRRCSARVRPAAARTTRHTTGPTTRLPCRKLGPVTAGISTRATSRRNLRIVENEAWHTPFMKATRAVAGQESQLDDGIGQRGVVELPAVRAPVRQALMFRNDGRCCRDFDLLEHFRLAPGSDERTAALRAAIQSVGRKFVDGFGWKRRSQVLLMSRLRASPAFFAVLARRLGGLTISLEGGLEEVEESLRAAANCCSSWVIREVLASTGLSMPQSPRLAGQDAWQEVHNSHNAPFPALHRAGRYASLAFRTRSTRRSPSQNSREKTLDGA